MLQVPRPCVAAINVREAWCSLRERTATRGKPVLSVAHVQTVGVAFTQVPWNTPMSVPTYSVFPGVSGLSGSIATSLTGVFGRSLAPGLEQFAVVQLTSCHVAPPSAVLKRWPFVSVPNANPEKAAYAVFPVGSAASTAIAET